MLVAIFNPGVEPCPWSWPRMRTWSARAAPPTCTIKALCLHFHSIEPLQKHHQTPFSMKRHGAAGQRLPQLWKPADQRDEAFLQENTRSLQRAEGGSDAVQKRAVLQVEDLGRHTQSCSTLITLLLNEFCVHLCFASVVTRSNKHNVVRWNSQVQTQTKSLSSYYYIFIQNVQSMFIMFVLNAAFDFNKSCTH